MEKFQYIPEGTKVEFGKDIVKIIFPKGKRVFPGADFDYFISVADGFAYEPDSHRADDHNDDLEKELRKYAETFFPKFKFDFMGSSRVEILSNKTETIATLKIIFGSPELRIFDSRGQQTQHSEFFFLNLKLKYIKLKNGKCGIVDNKKNKLAGKISIRNNKLLIDIPQTKTYSCIALPIDNRVNTLFPQTKETTEA